MSNSNLLFTKSFKTFHIAKDNAPLSVEEVIQALSMFNVPSFDDVLEFNVVLRLAPEAETPIN